MKTLYVLRHAKAELGDSSTEDADRDLTDRGVLNAENLGKLFAREGWKPDCVLCSPSRRTRQTLEAMTAQLAEPWLTHYVDALYLASATELIHAVQSLDDCAESAMLIGHNPGLHQLCLTLAASSPSSLMSDLAIKFPTCALATIELPMQHWSQLAPGTGRLRSFLEHSTVESLLED